MNRMDGELKTYSTDDAVLLIHLVAQYLTKKEFRRLFSLLVHFCGLNILLFRYSLVRLQAFSPIVSHHSGSL
jgi:hypothetical protein